MQPGDDESRHKEELLSSGERCLELRKATKGLQSRV